jgi:hypothetical protein
MLFVLERRHKVVFMCPLLQIRFFSFRLPWVMRVILFVSAFFHEKKLIFPTDALTETENFQIALCV